MATTHETPFTQTQQTWRDAVAVVTLRAKDRMGAAYHARLDKAQELVLDHKVAPYADGKGATVMSETDADKAYDVNGACECPDAQTKAPDGWCKHRLAVAIYRRAVEHGQEVLQQRLPDPAPAARAEHHEARVSANCHLTLAGRQVQLTVRTGATAVEVREVTGLLEGYLQAHPADAGNGTQASSAPPVPVCPMHQRDMKASKWGGWYCPEKLDDGTYCPNKVKAA